MEAKGTFIHHLSNKEECEEQKGCETENSFLTGLLEDLNATECEKCGGNIFIYSFILINKLLLEL